MRPRDAAVLLMGLILLASRIPKAQAPTVTPPVENAFAEPVYADFAAGDKTLHLEETWANLTTGASVFTATRSDGGAPWEALFSQNPSRYYTVSGTPDGFGSVQVPVIDYDGDAPIARHGNTAPYSAAHGDEHWFESGGDTTVDRRVASNTISSRTTTTITDTTKAWETDELVGWGTVDFYTGTFTGSSQSGSLVGSRTVVSNTADTITFTPSLDIASANSYEIGANGSAAGDHFSIRGWGSGNPLSSTPREAVVFEFAQRHEGTDWYAQGKLFDIGSASGGCGRFNYDPYAWNFGVGQPANCDAETTMCNEAYSTGGTVARYTGWPPAWNTFAPAFARSQTPDLSPAAGNVIVLYKQNTGWGTTNGLFALGGLAGSGGSRNADLTGTDKYLNEAGWLYTKIRITKEPDEVPYVYGRGRIEVWIGKTPGSLLKIMEYIGDDPNHVTAGTNEPPGLWYEKVWVAPDPADPLPLEWRWARPVSQTYAGGCSALSSGFNRCWSHVYLVP